MVFAPKKNRSKSWFSGCLMFKLILNGITRLDHNTEIQLILVDKPKHVISLIENDQTD
ncbi:hypothetical protein F383_31954 [Gossypium arboreum]|uniref:Uncharacterized protein n=1 Tax=Gossypium arboreum TaxID=29729 RepID=A0A0B0PNV0_GOSAR|nr:hypothetical protein F383_31954 [Gossypium arboreum]